MGERSAALEEFRRKIRERFRVLNVTFGLTYLTVNAIYSIYAPIRDFTALILAGSMIVAGIYIVIAIIAVMPKAPIGWATCALWFGVMILWIFSGVLDLAERDPLYFIIGIDYFLISAYLFLGLFVLLLPQAKRSVFLYFRMSNDLKRRTIPLNCWRDECFSDISKRLCSKSSFRRLLTKLHIPPNLALKFSFYERALAPESTPAQEKLKLFDKLALTAESD